MPATISNRPISKNLAVNALANIIVDSVNECDRGEGVKEGPMYAALMERVSHSQFNQVLYALHSLGWIRREPGTHSVYATEKGRAPAPAYDLSSLKVA